jgi:hypothetical protein
MVGQKLGKSFCFQCDHRCSTGFSFGARAGRNSSYKLLFAVAQSPTRRGCDGENHQVRNDLLRLLRVMIATSISKIQAKTSEPDVLRE